MEFQQYSVSKELQSHISHFWTLKSEDQDIAGATYRFIPDGSVDWVFHLESPWSYSFPGKGEKKQHQSHLIGQFKNYMDLTLPKGQFSLFAISFQPWAAQDFWKIDLSEVTDNSIALTDLNIPDQSLLESAVYETKDMIQRINQVENYLINHLSSEKDDSIANVIQNIKANPFALPVSKFANSKRRLQQRFKSEVGISPKHFQRTVRINKIIQQLVQQPRTNLTQLAYDFNFYDQSHFNLEFKRFTGFAPSQFLKSIRPSGPIYNLRVDG